MENFVHTQWFETSLSDDSFDIELLDLKFNEKDELVSYKFNQGDLEDAYQRVVKMANELELEAEEKGITVEDLDPDFGEITLNVKTRGIEYLKELVIEDMHINYGDPISLEYLEEYV